MKALLDEAIQVGRLNLVVTQSVDRVPTLVVCKYEQDVQTLGWLCSGRSWRSIRRYYR